MALNLSGGRVTPPSPWEAWERVNSVVDLSSIECRALNAIGGNYALKRSENIAVDRSNFVRAYTDFLNTDRKMSLSIPEVRQLAESNTREVTDPDHQIEEQEDVEFATPEQVKELLQGLNEKVRP